MKKWIAGSLTCSKPWKTGHIKLWHQRYIQICVLHHVTWETYYIYSLSLTFCLLLLKEVSNGQPTVEVNIYPPYLTTNHLKGNHSWKWFILCAWAEMPVRAVSVFPFNREKKANEQAHVQLLCLFFMLPFCCEVLNPSCPSMLKVAFSSLTVHLVKYLTSLFSLTTL